MNNSLLQASDYGASSTVSDFITLLKPRVMTLVVFTGLVGMSVALSFTGSYINLFQQILAVFCIALASGAGGVINMWYDRDIDIIMSRTKNRPIPKGVIDPDDALAFGLFLSAFSVMIMGLALNWLAASILAFAIFFYAVIYTMWLKRSTPQNIVIGGAAGAFPPMIGWAAVSGDVTVHSFLLFMIIFLWTPPHFWALALYKNDDYKKAGIPMMPVVAGKRATKTQIIIYTYLLAGCTMILSALGMAGLVYAVCALLLNLYFLYHVHKILTDDGDKWARKTFIFSIIYLFILFTAIMVDGWVFVDLGYLPY
ncbi:MAG: heme o synthase [Rickettsiales bacterium]